MELITSSVLLVFIGFFISYTHSFSEGSLSIACGFTNNLDNGWMSDTPFTKNRSSGEINTDDFMYARFAYFDNLAANKYCYLIPVEHARLYLVRTHFYPIAFQSGIPLARSFDLFINGIKWTEVNPDNQSTYEIILAPKSDSISLCLARKSETEKRYVFITEIVVRPLSSALYNSTDFNDNVLVLLNRSTFGRDSLIAFPEDEPDRIWQPYSPAAYDISNTVVGNFGKGLANEPPLAVLQTAITAKQVGDMVVSYPLIPSGSYYFALYFCNLKQANHSFQVSINGDQAEDKGWLHFTSFLQCFVEERNPKFDSFGSVNITLHPEEGSQTGPFINAAEAYQITVILNTTDLGDVMVIREIANLINAPDDWFGGDPCLPAGYPCTGIVCNEDNPSRVIILNLTDFGLSGEIPPSIAKLTALTQLLLGSNNLSGSIPDLSSLKNLAALELQNNQLTGEIPTSLANLPTLNRLYLENNKLNKTVPPGLYRPDLDLRVTAVSESHKKRNWIVGCVVGASLIAVVVASFLWEHLRRPGTHITDRSINPRQQEIQEIHAAGDHAKDYHRLAVEYTEEEIKAATNNNNSRLIAKGGFGSVYFGTLSGYDVAIKILSNTSDQGQKEFETEVTLLCRLYHKNLVKLIGYSKLPMGALVYEYMPSGTLKDLLHGKGKLEKPLGWNIRLNIALQAAEGLLYLHQGCNPPIIHRDIKCANILLDGKMTAKVADFGLAKLLDISKTDVTTKVKGTLGYLDPEYFETGLLTAKSDVYSFGVVLLEIISGKLPSDDLVKMATKLLSCGNIVELMDPSLDGHYKLSSAWKVAEVAYTCVAKKSFDRPTMSIVVEELKESLALEFNDISEYMHIVGMSLAELGSEMMPIAR